MRALSCSPGGGCEWQRIPVFKWNHALDCPYIDEHRHRHAGETALGCCWLDRLIAANATRVDFREKFEALIESYNAGSTQLEQLFLQLLELSRALTDEEARHVREHLSEEELVVFDLLTCPGSDLSTEERNDVKKVARQLLARLRGIFTVDWQKTAQSRARVREAIEDALDEGLPCVYTPDVFKAKAGAVFQHVYERYSQAA
ncbi:MAG TPA: type I restriction enzyme endonuclease domain-containing protein [Myxococcus sp.]|nr:type I restriction enzyme endonuclease domain-containing protein [Myxococcus sp.]